jgi:hypothetical protein
LTSGPVAKGGATRGRRWLDAALVALCPFVIALQPLANNDLPMHLAIGEWILDHSTLPSRDPFSFIAGGTPWVPHEWLAEVAFALAWRAGGLEGLVLFGAVCAAALAIIHRAVMARLGVGLVPHLLFSLPMWLIVGRRIVMRPHLPALILPFALWWCLLRARRDARWLVPLPLLLAVWVNLHGSFPMGFGIVVLDLLVFGRAHPLPWRPRLVALAAGALAFLAQVHVWFQPTLLAGLQDALGLLRDPVFMEEISEWKPPFTTPRFRETFAFQLSLPWLALAALGCVRHGSRTPLSWRAFAAASLLLYVRHNRFIDVLALATLPFVTSLAPRRLVSPSRRVRRAAQAATFPPRCCVCGLPVRPGRAFHSGAAGASVCRSGRSTCCCAARHERCLLRLQVRRRRGLAQRRRLRPTMDSRNSVYGAERYLAPAGAPATPYRQRLLDEVGAVLILRPTRLRDRHDLIEQLRQSKRWMLVHAGERSLLFVKRPVQPAP